MWSALTRLTSASRASTASTTSITGSMRRPARSSASWTPRIARPRLASIERPTGSRPTPGPRSQRGHREGGVAPGSAVAVRVPAALVLAGDDPSVVPGCVDGGEMARGARRYVRDPSFAVRPEMPVVGGPRRFPRLARAAARRLSALSSRRQRDRWRATRDERPQPALDIHADESMRSAVWVTESRTGADGQGAGGLTSRASATVMAMPSPLLADAFGHHVWATIRLLDACTALDDAQLATIVPGTYGSIIDTLRHVVDGDVFYLD